MPRSPNRLPTVFLAIGAAVLLVAIVVGQRMGDRVLTQVAGGQSEPVVPVTITPDPDQSSGPYGPDWKRSETLSAAADPRFPDPRIPPQPLPTRPPVPAPSATPAAPTPNPNIPIWRQQPLPTFSPSLPPPATPPASSPPAVAAPSPSG